MSNLLKYLRSALPVLGLLACAPAAQAQNAPLDTRTRTVVIDSLAVRLERLYVDLDTARLIGNLLRTRLRTGAYDSLNSAARFAEVVTRHMREINSDRHLSLQAQATQTAASGPNPNDGARRQNFGLIKTEIMPGNIGYLEIRAFQGQPGFENAVASALRMLENTDALLIDVRRNGGGSGQMSHLVFSHFLAAQPVETIRVYSRSSNNQGVRRSVAEVPGPRRTDVPLFVLTSQGTASAAEEFTFVLKNLKRATIVGDRTAGAGHMVSVTPLGNGFVAGISITRVMDARSGLEWEGAGVQPDLRVPADQALDAGYAAALRRVAGTQGDALLRRTLELLAESVDARMKPVAVDAAQMRALAGTYDEGRVIKLQDGKLWYYRRAEILPDELVPLGANRFALTGAQRVTFETRNGTTVLHVETPDGTRLSYSRLR